MEIGQKRRTIEAQEGLAYAQCEKNLEFFFRKSWRVLEPTTDLLSNWHQGCVAEFLTACYLRQIKRLIINMPPRYTKSLIGSVAFPAWVWAKNPAERFMHVSYSGGLSVKHSMDRRTLIGSDWYQRGYGDRFQLSGDQNLKTKFSNDKRGHMIATSTGGTATGLGGNILIVDDPHDTSRAGSQKRLQTDVESFGPKFQSRLDDKENGVIIVIMQRLNEGDLTGYLVEREGLAENGGVWTQLKLPATAPEKTIISLPISGGRVVRQEGSILHPERQDAEALAAEKLSFGAYQYAGQYDQEPAPREGGILKKAYWQYYRELPEKLDERIISVDATFTDSNASDFVAIQVWGRRGSKRYLIERLKRKMGFLDTCRAILDMKKRHPTARKVLIEKKANGAAILETLKQKVSGLIAVEPLGSKEERAAACEPSLEAGDIFLEDPKINTGTDEFILECATFPNGKHDDEVDAFTQANLYFDSKSVGSMNLDKLIRF
jgi:predicted phage terminase large subunit-like protein